MKVEIRELVADDRAWLRAFLIEHWGSPQMVYSKGVHECDQLPGFAAFVEGEVVGVATLSAQEDACEVVSLDSLREGRGIGSALMQAVEQWASEQGLARIRLITTNDNLNALAFYQKRGYELVRLYPRAVEAARRVKPQIPLIADNGLPIRDELELEKWI
ncbi:GNAT family N-acetyltransferase [Tumebacillus flagellatus]|uniref:GNAT family N-acetyltransferase n=1 Tax=Tumebacillus flagellatus TaxID=1157490 RepID=UPI0005705530|nr:GNAT family N-acetyltransferase [Tumebacillus flagellatus]